MSVMKNFGISLPHYSGSQANSGKRIKSSQMKPGDLIFYGSSRGRINHVAMYIGMDRSSTQRAEEAESRSLPGTTELRCALWM